MSPSTDVAIIYTSDGNDTDSIEASVASIRGVGVDADVFVLTVDGNGRGDSSLGGNDVSFIDVAGILDSFGFFPDGWNRSRPYATLACLAVPAVPSLMKYSRALVLDSSVLATGPRFAQWLSWPMRGFEVVGAASTDSGLGDRHSDAIEVDRCFTAPGAVAKMQQRIWHANPPYTRPRLAAGASLWDIDRIRSDIDWYRERLRWFWAAETRGYVVRLVDSFISVFTDSAALLSATMLARSGDGPSGVAAPAALVYSGGGNEHQAGSSSGHPADALSSGARKPQSKPAPGRADGVPFTERIVPDLEKAGRLAIVYITDGDTGDARRLVWSLRSLSRHSSARFDTFVIAPDESIDLMLAVPGLERHGVASTITDMPGTLAELSITDKGWNRSWPFAVLLRLGIPLHHAFDDYDRVLYLDTDTIVRSRDVDWLLTVDLRGVEVGGVVDTVQEEHNRIRGVFNHDLRPDYARAIFARYGDKILRRAYINAGVLLWNLPEIRKDIAWYKERLGMFWEAECRGKFGFLDQDFINSMMETRSDLSLVFNWFNGCNRDNPRYVIKHYCGRRYAEMETDATKAGLV